MKKWTPYSLPVIVALGITLAGCGSSDFASEVGPTTPQSPQPIEEADLYKIHGDYLYVQNATSGLNIIDIKTPNKPRLLGRAATGGGGGSEIYVRSDRAIILLKTATAACNTPQGMEPNGWKFHGEVVIVNTQSKTHPKLVDRYCVPGDIVASRTLGNILYMVTFNGTHSRALSFDINSQNKATVVSQMDFPNASKEIKLTQTAMFVVSNSTGGTTVEYISIDTIGKLVPRGSYTVKGQPQGRFHMDLSGIQFRIVTYDANQRNSILTILDISDPDNISLIGSLDNIGKGEKLYATRFDGHIAYVVTFRQTDPLWVISLEDPTNPTIVGSLHVPGWSDFIFPRGNKLLTVGRGDRGNHLGISLFDVSNLESPRTIQQISLGNSSSGSEANVDHRGVTIVESGSRTIIIVPYTSGRYSSGSCQAENYLQLVELTVAGLKTQGRIKQVGTIRRATMVKASLFSISDHEVLSMDISDLNQPRVDTSVTVGLGSPDQKDDTQYCGYMHGGDEEMSLFFCNMSRTGVSLPPVTVVIGLAWLGMWIRRRRKQ